MMHPNYDDIYNQLIAGGLRLDHTKPATNGLAVGTTKPVRCRVEGADAEFRGWYWLHEILLEEDDGTRQPYIVGAYGTYQGADPGKIKLQLRRADKVVKLSSAQMQAVAARQKADMAAMKAREEAMHASAAAKASSAWRKYTAEGNSDYLAKKNVKGYGVRFSPSGNGTMAVPMMDATGRIWGLQIIRGKNRGGKLEKQNWPLGHSLKAHFHMIGTPPRSDDVVLIAEGYATAATLHEATGHTVVVAFTANNMLPVAGAINKAYRGAQIVVCADDDYLTAGNPGVTHAQLAAHAVGGSHIAPVFAEARPQDKKGATDFNDLAALEGIVTVRAQIENHLAGIGFKPRAAVSRAASQGGAGSAASAFGSGIRESMPSIIQIEEARERFSLVYGVKDTMFDHTEHMLVPKSSVLDILPEHGWRDLRKDKKVVRLDEVGFDPACTDKRITCNLWGGWPTTAKQGDCTNLLDLLLYLCTGENNSRDLYQWVLKWLAYPIQNPGAKMRTALVFHGPQGTGKNLFFETVMGIYGEYGRIVDQSAVEDKFNDWSSRKLFLIADEVVARAELFHVKNKLKGLVTGEWIRINPKNVAAHDERNHVNLVFLSNEAKPLILEKDDRRYTVVWTPEKLPPDFYQTIREELNNGGQAALHYYLLNEVDCTGFDEHTKPPMTQAKEDLIEASADTVERFIRDWQNGEIAMGADTTPLPFGPCLGSSLYRFYERWCRENGEHRPRPSNAFVSVIGKVPGWQAGKTEKTLAALNGPELKSRKMIVPSHKDIKTAATHSNFDPTEQAGMEQKPGEERYRWLARCFFAIEQRLAALL
jgi:putative DNA primase/helicase